MIIKPPIFDVSGAHGASGISGRSLGHSCAGSDGIRLRGGDGQRGGDGTDGQCGASASTIDVQLTTPTTTADTPKNLNVVLPNPINADVKVDASIRTAGRLQKMDAVLKIKPEKLMCFFALGGNGGAGGAGGHGEHGGPGLKYGTFLVLSFNESISEYARRTGGRMQLKSLEVLMAVLVVTEEMAVTQVKAVMADLEEPFESLLPKPTLISLCSVAPSSILAEKGVQQGNQGWEASLFRVILPRPV